MADETYTTLAIQIAAIVENIPTAVSGNGLLAQIDRARIDVETYTGLTVGSPNIPDRFKNAVLNKTLARVHAVKSAVGTDKSIRLGDLSVDGGSSNQDSKLSLYYEQQANADLAVLGRSFRYGRTY